MLKACLVGAAVTLALIAIPGVHLITGPPSAFIGGYLAGSRAEATPGMALLIGLSMAALLVVPVAGVFFAMSLCWGFGAIAVLVGTGAFVVWIVLLGTLGALIGGNSVLKQTTAE
ncbi:MAG: hypothetical protein O2826_03060 [Chloroflexi bacterium]|nr:hypothetical protein [Chloroflexota bacterium]MDA1173481.1 hypothetical protein [Chloroflexota bacterium]